MLRNVFGALQGSAMFKCMFALKSNFKQWQTEEWNRNKGLRQLKSIMVKLQGNAKISVMMEFKLNHKSAIMDLKIKELLRDDDVGERAVQEQQNNALANELEEVKRGGALAVLRMIYKKMANAGIIRILTNWKTSKVMGQRQDTALRMLRRTMARLEEDDRENAFKDMTRNFQEWKQDDWTRTHTMKRVRNILNRLKQGEALYCLTAFHLNCKEAFDGYKVAFGIIRRSMKNAEMKSLVSAVNSWSEEMEREKIIGALQQEANSNLMSAMAQARQEGGVALMKMFAKRMQQAVYIQYMQNFKENKNADDLSSKIDRARSVVNQRAKARLEAKAERRGSPERTRTVDRRGTPSSRSGTPNTGLSGGPAKELRLQKEMRHAALRMMRQTRTRIAGDMKHVAVIGLLRFQVAQLMHRVAEHDKPPESPQSSRGFSLF